MAQPTARLRRLELWVPLVIVALDQLTKWLVRVRVPLHDSVQIIPNLLDITHVRNTGAAFGFLNGVDFPGKTLVIAVVAKATSSLAAGCAGGVKSGS